MWTELDRQDLEQARVMAEEIMGLLYGVYGEHSGDDEDFPDHLLRRIGACQDACETLLDGLRDAVA